MSFPFAHKGFSVSENSVVSTPGGLAGGFVPPGFEDAEARRKTLSRALAALAVLLLHIAILNVLVIRGLPLIKPPLIQPKELQLVLIPLKHPAVQPRVINAVPEHIPQEVIPKPITIIPPVVVTPEETEKDALRALGIALACGASRYEYLSATERKLCPHKPWNMPKNRNIAIVPPPAPPALVLTGAEAAAKLRAQAPACPILQNTPCLDKVINPSGLH